MSRTTRTRNPSAHTLAALALLAAAAGVAGCDAAPRTTGPDDRGPTVKVGSDVAGAIRAQGAARVVIALDPSAMAGADVAVDPAGRLRAATDTRAGRERLRERVQDLVDGFVARVDPSDVDAIRRYELVPALAGTVRSAAALERLASDPAVRRIDLDVGGGGGLIYSVSQIGADTRHAIDNDGEGVVVAILDTGIESSHPSLVGRVVHQACFGANNGSGFCPNGSSRQTGGRSAEDDAGHGTHVAGIVASDGTVGDPGVAPGVDLVSIKVTDDCSFAGCFYFFSEIVAALEYIVLNNESLGVSVINMSLGTGAQFEGVCDESTSYNMAAAQVVGLLRDAGVLAFASAMNTGSSTEMGSPACLQDVIAVAAVDNADIIASFSNVNTATALFAPGVTIGSLARGGGITFASGTSMAAPHAAGCAALLRHAAPGRDVEDLAARILTSPVMITDDRNGVTLPRLDCTAGADPTDPRGAAGVVRP